MAKLTAKQKASAQAKGGGLFRNGPRAQLWKAALNVYEPGMTDAQFRAAMTKTAPPKGVAAVDWIALITALLPIIQKILEMLFNK